MKIGVYGGTFNPIHFGHLNLAIEMMEKHQLDEVWFCPAYINPLRQNENPIAVHHRMNMIALAISDIPQFKLITIEADKEEPSYTVDTLRQLIAIENKNAAPAQLFLILGADTVKNFLQWKEPEKIIELVPLLIGSRNSFFEFNKENDKIAEAMNRGMTPTRYLEISSTEIRQRVSEGLYCKHLAPTKVIDYIYENHLYYSA